MFSDEDATHARHLIALLQGAQRESARHTARTIETPGSGTDVASRIFREVAEFYDGYLERLNPRFSPACFKGCDFCCHMYVSATIPEVVAMAAVIMATWPDDARKELLGQLGEYRAELRKQTPSEIAKSRRPCPLLRDGKCNVYDARPLACRGYHSLDAEACRLVFLDPATGPRIPVDIRGAMTTQLSRGIAEGSARKGCASTSVGLVAGLETVLKNPGIADAWRHGKRVFLEASDKALRKTMPELDVTVA